MLSWKIRLFPVYPRSSAEAIKRVLTFPVRGNSVPGVEHLKIEEALAGFGLTRQEAAVYSALLGTGPLNGYEAAKELAVSRSNAYTALSALVEKGAAWLADGTPARYVPVPPGEFCSGRIAAMERAREFLLEALPERKPEPGVFITIRGRDRIMDRLRAMIGECSERLYIAAPWQVIQEAAVPLAKLAAEGLRIVILTDREFAGSGALETAAGAASLPEHNRVEYHGIERGAVELRLITDSSRVLTGDVSGPDPSCLYSDQKNFADFFKDALRNEIRFSRQAGGEGRS